MSRPNRVLKILDELPADLTLNELREMEARLRDLMNQKSKAAQQRTEYAAGLERRYPGLQSFLESGQGKLGERKSGSIYAPTGIRLTGGLSAKDLLDQDRADQALGLRLLPE